MLESRRPLEHVNVSGEEHLEEIHRLNQEGKYFLFAPNHLRPASDIRAQMALAEDFPVLNTAMKEYDVSSRVVFRGDTDMNVGADHSVRRKLYDIHRSVFSHVGQLVTGGIPLNINNQDRTHAITTNATNVREMVRTLQEQDNLTLYPYGEWFPSGEQTFDANTDLNNDAFFDRNEDGARWKKSLKSGFIRMARKTQSPIVPVYVEQNKGEWIIRFAEPIQVTDEKDDIAIAKEYLASMQQLKSMHAETRSAMEGD